MNYYEVQRFVRAQWETYSIFDEQSLAIDTAKGLMNSARAPAAVRVIEEDDDGGPSRTIFRETLVDGHNKDVVQRRIDNRREVDGARAARQLEKGFVKGSAAATAESSKPIDWWMLYLRFASVLTVGWLLMILIRHS